MKKSEIEALIQKIGEDAKTVAKQFGEFKEPITFECPFCKGGKFAVDGAEGGSMCILHTLPACKDFLKEDEGVVEFLRRARVKMSGAN